MVMFAKQNQAVTEFKIGSIDLQTGESVEVLSDPLARHFTWARDGRLVYARIESSTDERNSNLWEIPVDVHTGRVAGKARRLTKWTDFSIIRLSVSADAQRLGFIRGRSQSNVYIAELAERGEQPATVRSLTLDEWMSWPTAWTRDGEAILFHSNRQRVLNVFRQGIDGSDAETIIRSPQENRDARMTPDGRWVLYLSWAKPHDNTGALMRVSAAGGKPVPVFPISGYPGPAEDEPRAPRPVPYAGEGNVRFRCPFTVGAPCVMSEKVHNEIVFTAFDAIEGRTGELARTRIEPFHAYFWDLSPDGRRIAFGVSEETRGVIRIVPLSTEATRDIAVKGWANLTSVAWAPDGKALFVAGWASKRRPLLRVFLDGRIQVLLRMDDYIESVVPSLDGRRVAFANSKPSGGNVWLIDHFR
jgi:dipeptidyl aminopeptidase/acylaminoacyl peptidase